MEHLASASGHVLDGQALPVPPAGEWESDQAKRLVEARLGVASGLYTALRHKHAPTAAQDRKSVV